MVISFDTFLVFCHGLFCTGKQGTWKDEDKKTKEARKSLTPFHLSYMMWGPTVPFACRI
jgi:hypothetical protein